AASFIPFLLGDRFLKILVLYCIACVVHIVYLFCLAMPVDGESVDSSLPRMHNVRV
ncbi:hypothetical protein L9F63_025583, partial [Diploptera punctata]